MRQTKLVEALRTLDARERNRWRQYVHSDFFNKHARLRQLCDYLLALAPAWKPERLRKQDIYHMLFDAKEPYNELKINNLISDLYELLLGFLAYTRQENDPLEQQYHAVMALSDRNLDKHAAAALDRYGALLRGRADRTADWYRAEMKYWEADDLLQNRLSRRNTTGEQLRRQAEATAHTHLLEKLQLEVSMLSRSTLSVKGNSDQNSVQVPEKSGLLESAAHLSPAVRVYHAAHELLLRPALETLGALVAELAEHHTLFRKDELRALYQCALNYCIRRINDGQPGAYADTLDLYRTLLDREVLLQGGRLSQWTYKNIATAGLRSGNFDWTEQFLNQYREMLPPTERDNAFAFNLATLYFEKQDFTKALRTLQNVEFTDVTYHMGAKIMQLKAFYLLDEWEALQSLLDSTEQWLRRNKTLSPFGKTTNINFLRMLRQIGLHTERLSLRKTDWNAQKQVLVRQVHQTQPLANKEWLLKILA